MSSRSVKDIDQICYKLFKQYTQEIESHGSSVLATRLIEKVVGELGDTVPRYMLIHGFVAHRFRKWHSKAKVTFDSPQQDMFAGNMHLVMKRGEFIEWKKATVPMIRIAHKHILGTQKRTNNQIDNKKRIMRGVIDDARRLGLEDRTVDEIVRRARGRKLIDITIEIPSSADHDDSEDED